MDVTNNMDSILNSSDNTTDVFIRLKGDDVLLIKINKKDYDNITCDNLLEKINKSIFKSDNFSNFFSLWMVSPLLEMQLKKSYMPFCILACWDELIKNFTLNELLKNEKRIQNDIPELSFQRNIYLKKSDELNINNSTILKLLYEEAKENISKGKYLFEDDHNNYEYLAAIQFIINHDLNLNENIVNLPYLRMVLNDLLPKYYFNYTFGSFMSLKRFRNTSESKIFNYIQEKFKNFSLNDLYIEYLRICHLSPTYGAAFYDGQIEKDISLFSSLYKNYDIKVSIAINYDGIHIIDKKAFKMITSFSFNQFNWELGVSQNIDENTNSLPCLFLEIVSDDSTNEKKLLQIFSKKSKLMDNTLKEFDRILKKDSDNVDTCSFNNSISSFKNLCLNKLACATFNSKGECIKKKRSFKLVK